jgi:hypothetical protein
MTLEARIEAFKTLGKKFEELTDEDYIELEARAFPHNRWFTKESIEKAFGGIAYMLQEDKLTEWTKSYKLEPEVPKIVGIVMAGNIPLVGFHDLMSVLIAGHFAAIKLSSQDEILMKQVLSWLEEIEPRLKKSFETREKLTEIDAVIATGSDNTARYFEYYFGKVPHIIRKNRTAVAILSGKESDDDLEALGHDIYDYFGLGCRNVSKLFIPEDMDFTKVLDKWNNFEDLLQTHKYKNNYDYHKSILLVNREEHLDTGFSLFKPSVDLVSPTSVVYTEKYKNSAEVTGKLADLKDKIQCIVTQLPIDRAVPFGKAQQPELWDYADGVNTLEFLDNL